MTQTQHASQTILWSDHEKIIKQLQAEHEAERAHTREEMEKMLTWQDLVVRTLRNRNMSPVYRELYISLVDTYPDLLTGRRVAISLWKVRENAAWASKESCTKFMQDLRELNAFVLYDPGKYDQKEENRIGYLMVNLDVFAYPELLDTKKTEGRRRARAAEKKKLESYRQLLSISQCEICASENLEYDVLIHCKSCGHNHEPLIGLAQGTITITEEAEIADEFSAALGG